jgi:hypothetical protein
VLHSWRRGAYAAGDGRTRRDGGAGSLWTVQAWGPGGLARLAEYPARRQEVREAAFWPPVQRVRDNGSGPRHRFVRNAVTGVIASLAAIHQRGWGRRCGGRGARLLAPPRAVLCLCCVSPSLFVLFPPCTPCNFRPDLQRHAMCLTTILRARRWHLQALG